SLFKQIPGLEKLTEEEAFFSAALSLVEEDSLDRLIKLFMSIRTNKRKNPSFFRLDGEMVKHVFANSGPRAVQVLILLRMIEEKVADDPALSQTITVQKLTELTTLRENGIDITTSALLEVSESPGNIDDILGKFNTLKAADISSKRQLREDMESLAREIQAKSVAAFDFPGQVLPVLQELERMLWLDGNLATFLTIGNLKKMLLAKEKNSQNRFVLEAIIKFYKAGLLSGDNINAFMDLIAIEKTDGDYKSILAFIDQVLAFENKSDSTMLPSYKELADPAFLKEMLPFYENGRMSYIFGAFQETLQAIKGGKFRGDTDFVKAAALKAKGEAVSLLSKVVEAEKVLAASKGLKELISFDFIATIVTNKNVSDAIAALNLIYTYAERVSSVITADSIDSLENILNMQLPAAVFNSIAGFLKQADAGRELSRQLTDPVIIAEVLSINSSNDFVTEVFGSFVAILNLEKRKVFRGDAVFIRHILNNLKGRSGEALSIIALIEEAVSKAIDPSKSVTADELREITTASKKNTPEAIMGRLQEIRQSSLENVQRDSALLSFSGGDVLDTLSAALHGIRQMAKRGQTDTKYVRKISGQMHRRARLILENIDPKRKDLSEGDLRALGADIHLIRTDIAKIAAGEGLPMANEFIKMSDLLNEVIEKIDDLLSRVTLFDKTEVLRILSHYRLKIFMTYIHSYRSDIADAGRNVIAGYEMILTSPSLALLRVSTSQILTLIEDLITIKKDIEYEGGEGELAVTIADMQEMIDENIGELRGLIASRPEGKGDAAVLSENPGGIDFNPANMDLKEQGDKLNFKFDNSFLINISPNSFEGMTPVIINITPVNNFMLLLGMAEEKQSGKI
ncbi:MAG: hypothetical protein HQL27_05100, partial [Candidatus Omnitrophica bacterium]|nr:hypothetical protein [Candidatus Omnitrophota bacterium]